MTLSPTQKWIIVAGTLCLAALAIIVPWNDSYGGPIGYGFIFYPKGVSYRATKVDIVRIIIPMAIIVVATVVGVFLTSRPKSPEPPPA